MLFNSYEFLLFFPIVVLIYFIVPKKARYIWLLIASYFFYMCWNIRYVLLIAFSTLTTFLCGYFVDKCNCNKNLQSYKKLFVVFNIGINVLILVFFKYTDFLVNSLNEVFILININVIENPFDIILPVGISFYTFQALGYSIDVYRGNVVAEKNFFRYALFVSFFPQLVAGPIERSRNLLSQIDKIEKIRLFNYERITSGLILMLWGFFLKMVIADRVAILVNTVFDEYYMYASFELVIAAIGFAIQIYCDFYSYSIIAIGAAKVMGFKLMDNFSSPYFSHTIKEFWRNWHISLSTWFKDYVYIPLGGNRCSKKRNYINLLITFTISGLWHGANWTFIIWGGLHGLFQIIGFILQPIKTRINTIFHTKTASFSYHLGQIVVTFILVTIAWIFFRSNTLNDSIEYILRMLTLLNPWAMFDGSLYTLGLDRFEFNILVFSISLLIIFDYIKYKKGIGIDVFLKQQCMWFRWGFIFLILFCTIIYGKYGGNFNAQQFIYFQF